jgi:hypothetical protein
LKSCLVLNNFDVKFKSDNFTKENMESIEFNWDSIALAFEVAVRILAKLGYSNHNLLSNNIVIPIAHFLYVNNIKEEILHSLSRKTDLTAIREWLARVSLMGIFSSTTDSIYPGMRKVINDNLGRFPLPEIIQHYKGTSKSIIFSSDDIDNLLELQYGKPKTYCALTLLYPGLNQNFFYHQDHMHPKSFFDKRKLKNLGLDNNQIEQYIKCSNSLTNIQLLQETINGEKSDLPLEDWVKLTCDTPASRQGYLTQNHISIEQNLEFKNFLKFIADRRKLLRNEFMRILNVNSLDGAKKSQ